jgi:hypothetical protein
VVGPRLLYRVLERCTCNSAPVHVIDPGGSKEHRAGDPGEHLPMPVAISRIQTCSPAGMRDTSSLAGYRAGKRRRGLEHGVAARATRPDDLLDLLAQRLSLRDRSTRSAQATVASSTPAAWAARTMAATRSRCERRSISRPVNRDLSCSASTA